MFLNPNPCAMVNSCIHGKAWGPLPRFSGLVRGPALPAALENSLYAMTFSDIGSINL